VNNALEEEFATGLHALSIIVSCPSQSIISFPFL
jgi:stress-induced morphogen